MQTCPECGIALRGRKCPECGWEMPRGAPQVKEPQNYCQWLAESGQCKMRGSVRLDGEGEYCSWHSECKLRGDKGEDYQEFEAFCLKYYGVQYSIPALWDMSNGRKPGGPTKPNQESVPF